VKVIRKRQVKKAAVLVVENAVELVYGQIKYKLVGENAKSPGEALCRTALDEQADMIVMGSRGLGAVKRAMMGSVSEYVVRHSGLPCIIVHKKELLPTSGVTTLG